MKQTRNFYSALRVSTCIALAATFSQAPALASTPEPELYFYPAQSWAVEKTGSQCSITSRFNNGFVLRLHGNEKWVQGLDIDFQQDIFEQGTAYDLSLSVPGIKNQTFKATGESPNLLGVRLNREKDFYQALRKASVLDIKLEENNFRFYLTGFDGTAGQFERCMADASMSKTAGTGESMLQDNSFMINESIALEEKAKMERSGIIEIVPEIPQPVVQEIPFTETHKVGDITIPDPAESSPTPITAEEDIAQPAVPPRKRLSEQLAEQIQNNPSLIEVDDSEPLQRQQNRKSLEMPPNMDEMPLIPPAAENAGERSLEPIDALAAAKPEPKPAPEPVDVVRKDKPTPQEEERIVFDTPRVSVDTEIAAIKTEEPSPAPQPKEDVSALAKPPSEALLEKAETMAPPPKPAANPAPAPVRKTYATPPMTMHKKTASADADFTNIEPAAAPSPDTAELRKQMLALQETVENLKSENRSLNQELKTALRESEEERLNISSENWNLERATMQFNEAERQIKRLGQQLQRERAKHNQEKRELEAMLFDPQVTNEAQLARLADLESQLMKAKRDMEAQRLRYEEQLRAARGSL